jgi:hypothetical protein
MREASGRVVKIIDQKATVGVERNKATEKHQIYDVVIQNLPVMQ